MSSRVAIIDYGLCNVDSVRRAVQDNGGDTYVVRDGNDIGSPNHIVLPGVGAFGDAMRNLTDRNLHKALEREVLEVGVPLLGICLGMQLLAHSSAESPRVDGFGWIDATVERLEATPTDRRIPHLGWNNVALTRTHPLFDDIDDDTDFYFVHSYYVAPADPALTIGTNDYCGGFTAAIASGPVMGVQFHPEKSQRAGFSLLANFLRI